MQLTAELKADYARRFDTCVIRENRMADVDALVERIAGDRKRYAAAGDPVGTPWYVVGVIHALESSLNFGRHLHNGDPLTARTVQVPAGRPKTGKPPFTWEASASDALRYQGFDRWKDWSIPGTLYKLEAYNGFGYRMNHPDVPSPYLWSFSMHYGRGKYVADGKWSQTAVSAQCGVAVLLRRLAEKNLITLGGAPKPPKPQKGPILRYAPSVVTAEGKQLQRFLNGFPGTVLREDGKLGVGTSDAFKRITGRYLAGDPRAKQPPAKPV
jgi:lysozyme family protein